MGMAKELKALIDCHLVTTDVRDASTSLVQTAVCTEDRQHTGIWSFYFLFAFFRSFAKYFVTVLC